MPKVVELAPLFAGPLVGQLLRHGGCHVVKVEPPRGDPALRLPPLRDGRGFLYDPVNDGKDVVHLDLGTPAGIDALRRLVADADVLIDGHRPGTLERWLDPAALAKAGKVVLRLSGHGQSSALAAARGHDLTYAAHAGLVGLQGGAFAIPVADVAGALWGVAQAWRHLALRQGAVLDVSLTGSAELFASLPRWMAGAAPGRNDLVDLPWYGVHRCRDGQVTLGALEPELVSAAAKALDIPVDAKRPAIEAALASRSATEVVAALAGAGVGAAVVGRGGGRWGADDPPTPTAAGWRR